MRPLPRRLILAAALLGVAATDPEGNYDQPLDRRVVDLGPSATAPEQHAELRCHYFRSFMVKEIDARELGAEQLSIVPAPKGFPPCQRANVPGEIVISPEVWPGYFAGAVGRYVIFRSYDGSNGALGFAVFAATAKAPIYSATSAGPLRFDTTAAGRLTLRFDKGFDAACSVPKDSAACIQAIAKATGAPPLGPEVCASGYESARRLHARWTCDEEKDSSDKCFDTQLKAFAYYDTLPSAVAVPTEVTFQPTAAPEQILGPPRACWPQD